MPSRRDILKASSLLPAFGIPGAAMYPVASSAYASLAGERRIDVHHHIMPPQYAAATRQLQEAIALSWTPEQSIADMDRAGISTAITSVSSPGVWLGDQAQGRRLARDCNDYAAALREDYPGRFGMFAAIPLPDSEGSLREIEYAFDVLKADGVALLTSYREKWLGDPSFDPIMRELDRREAVAYTHPTAPLCCNDLLPGLVPDTAIEFGTDTTRAIASLMFRGTATRFPRIRWIFSHGGGTVPFLIERMVIVGQTKSIAANIPQGVEAQLRRFYYDIAQIAYPAPIAALTRVADPSHILWGTDFPFRHGEEYVQRLPGCGLGVSELQRIERENALRLFPRLRVDRHDSRTASRSLLLGGPR